MHMIKHPLLIKSHSLQFLYGEAAAQYVSPNTQCRLGLVDSTASHCHPTAYLVTWPGWTATQKGCMPELAAATTWSTQEKFNCPNLNTTLCSTD